ncbi:MAG: hypothetical protein K2V38_17300, partial [Gemmataceae bacterium]|nr:hypothetical protein [Gemmataceae bacterium]
GLAQATGQICTYLNSDDLLRPGAVRRVVEHFADHPTCDLVYGRDALIDANGAYIGMYPTADYSFERLVESCCISQPAAFWRKRIGDLVGPFDESLKLVMDYDYWLRVDRAGGILEHIPDILAHTRIHRDAKSSGSGKAETHRRTFYQELFDVSLRHAGYVSSVYVHMWLYACVFNARPWTRRYEEFLTRVVQNWYHLRHRCGLSRYRTIRTVFGEERRRVPRLILNQFRWLHPRAWKPTPRPKLDFGHDLWLGPEQTVLHPGGPLKLVGVPSRDTVLKVFRGADELAAIPLKGDTEAEVSLDIPPAPPTVPLRLVFTDAEPLPDGRSVAFKLRGTTLFGEKDVA